MDGVALKGLTVDFHEPGFVSTLNSENQQPFWFEMSREQKQQAGSPWGPANPQALNRYAYVQNNPLKWTDPSGHCPVCAAIGWVFTAAGFTVSAPVVVGVAAVLGVAALAVFLSDETNRAWLAEQISSGISNVDSFVEQLSGRVEQAISPPKGLVENPNRPGGWGKYDGPGGKFREYWRYSDRKWVCPTAL
jgi:hypothetical protein